MKRQSILVGVCGGVAAFKVVQVVSALAKKGHSVRVAMSEAATRFVTPTTFSSVSGTPTLSSLWTESDNADPQTRYPHLYPATEANVFLLAPATADMIAQIAHGFGKDVVSTSALSLPASCTKVFCPAMNVEMWRNPFVQENVARLRKAGWVQLGPDEGLLACGMEGPGRMREPADILMDLESLFGRDTRLKGKSILILSGPTREHFDPIRYIGNPSSGKMGQAIAHAAARHSATVQFVTGPVPEAHLPHGDGIHLHKVTSAEEMLGRAREHLADADAVIYVAAVADYRPAVVHADKLPKHTEAFDIRLVPTPDLAATLNAEKRPNTLAIGFALQTSDGPRHASEKLRRKHLNAIVLNAPDSLGAGDGQFDFLTDQSPEFHSWGRLPKSEAAERILAHVLQHLSA